MQKNKKNMKFDHTSTKESSQPHLIEDRARLSWHQGLQIWDCSTA